MTDLSNIFGLLDAFSPVFLLLAVFVFYMYGREKRMRYNLLKNLFDASEHGKVLFNANGTLLEINDNAVEALSSFIPDNVRMITQGDLLDHLYDCAADFDESIRNTILGGEEHHADSDFREVISSNNNLYLVSGRPINKNYTLFSFSNINVAREREADRLQIDQVNRHLFHAMQAVTSGIIISDPKIERNPVVFANRSFFDFLGCSESDLLEEHWQVLASLLPDEHEKRKFLSALSDYNEEDISLSCVFEDDRKYYTLKLAPVYDQDDKLDLYVGIMTDVTLLKQRESEFFHSQKLDSLGQLAAGVAHDFNNLLSIISGYSMMISKQAGDRENIKTFSEKIASAAERGAGLTRKMLTFSRHKVVTQDVIDLCEIVEEQSELLMPLLSGPFELDLVLSEDRPSVNANLDSLGQVLMNLAINARDAMPDGGVLQIGVDTLSLRDIPDRIHKKIGAEDYVRLFVKDNGTGIDPDTLSRVFDPFFSTKEQGKGTGLGLSVVYGLVNEMSGAIDVTSKVGQGTTFSIYLPRSYAKKTRVIVGDVHDIESIRLDGYTALVVEDEADLLDIVRRMLETVGMDVTVASDGNKGLIACDESDGGFDIILTDVIMPELNGVKFVELVQALYPDLKIVFMSGYPAQGDMSPVDIPEGKPFIAKPVDYEALIRVVFDVLNNKADANHDMSHWHSSDVQIQDDNCERK